MRLVLIVVRTHLYRAHTRIYAPLSCSYLYAPISIARMLVYTHLSRARRLADVSC